MGAGFGPPVPSTPSEIRRWYVPLSRGHMEGEPHSAVGSGALLEEVLFGFMDGIVTNLALIAGLVAAVSTSHEIALAGIAATLAGATSMFVGAYISSHARYEHALRELERERREVDEIPDEERAEIREIYRRRGFTPEEVAILERRITANKDLWVDMMMHEELGFSDEDLSRPPLRHGAAIGLSYLVGSLLPLIPFLILPAANFQGTLGPLTVLWTMFLVTLVSSSVILLALGAVKERFGAGRPLRGALQLLGVGLGGAAAVYVISAIITSIR